MFDKKELRRLARLHRLARQIAASLPAEICSTHALRVNECTDRLLKRQHDSSQRAKCVARVSRPAGSPQPLARRPDDPHGRFPLSSLLSSESLRPEANLPDRWRG